MNYLEFVNQNFPWSELRPHVIKTITTKKESDDYIFAIPFGAKMYLWSTEINDSTTGQRKQVCFLLQKTKKQNTFEKVTLPSIQMQPGVVLYGSFVKAERRHVFCIENINLFKNKSQIDSTWANKLNLIRQILNECKSGFTILGVPLFAKTTVELETLMQRNQLYKTYAYLYCTLSKSKSTLFICNRSSIYENVNSREEKQADSNLQTFDQQNVLDMLYGVENKKIKPPCDSTSIFTKKPEEGNKNRERIQVLLVKPDIQNDIYHLFSKDKQTYQYTKSEGVALIPNYETSVMLNSKFRKIKENDNLDALEESDDEEEFEDNREDKFVNLSKSLLFQCTFNFKFRKWIPIKCQEN